MGGKGPIPSRLQGGQESNDSVVAQQRATVLKTAFVFGKTIDEALRWIYGANGPINKYLEDYSAGRRLPPDQIKRAGEVVDRTLADMRAALAEKKANGNGHSSGNGATAPDGTEDHVAKARIEADRIRKAAHAEGVRSAREEARRIVAASRQEAERALASAERKQKELEELEQAIETRRRELEALEQQDQPVTTDPAVTHVNKSANTELEAAAQLREEAEAQLRQAQASREEAEAELLAAQQANEEAQRAQAEAAEARAEAEPVRSETSPAATCGSCSVDPEAIARRVAELLAYSVVQHQRPTEHEQPEEPRLVGRDDPSTGAPPAQTASVKEPPWMKWSDPAKRRKALAGMG